MKVALCMKSSQHKDQKKPGGARLVSEQIDIRHAGIDIVWPEWHGINIT